MVIGVFPATINAIPQVQKEKMLIVSLSVSFIDAVPGLPAGRKIAKREIEEKGYEICLFIMSI